MAAFSSDAQRCIDQQIERNEYCRTELKDLKEVFKLDLCNEWIKQNRLSKVCLQFPDVLLCDATEVALQLQQLARVECYILGDTSYGSCCVDEVSAEHINGDGIIHFGRACLSPTRRLPVLYIFQNKPIDVQMLSNAIRTSFEDSDTKLLLIYDNVYSHKIEEVHQLLSQQYQNIVSAYPNIGKNQQGAETCLGCSYQLPEGHTVHDYQILYIGEDGRTFTNFFLELAGSTVFRYDPQEHAPVIQPSDRNISRFLMKRLHLVERVKDANTIGILIGTLGVDGYLNAVERIKLLAKRTGKKTYILAVGRPNVPKLANFPEVDVFVLVACPENSLLDWKEFYQPVVSLYEIELACNSARQWSSKYVTDFRQLLPGGQDHVELSDTQKEDLQDVSLVTGKLRTVKIPSISQENSVEMGLATKADLSVCLSSGSQFLSNRSWQGLEQNLGQTPVELASTGRSGIASSYQTEPIHKDC